MTVSCQQCGHPIDPAKVKKGGQKRCPKFCTRECHQIWNRQHGVYQDLSKAGQTAQAAYKSVHGHVPGYERRAAVLRDPNRTNRRKKRERPVEGG